MQKDSVVLLAKYNKTANEKMNAVIKTLSAEEWEKPLGGYFKSVRGSCSHLYVCDFNYLKRFLKLRDFALSKDSFFNRDPYQNTEILFPDMGEYLAKRPELDAKLTAFVDEIKDEDLGTILKYTDPRGRLIERNFGGLVMHNFNHDTHHRGMLSLYLELLGKDNDFNSLASVL